MTGTRIGTLAFAVLSCTPAAPPDSDVPYDQATLPDATLQDGSEMQLRDGSLSVDRELIATGVREMVFAPDRFAYTVEGETGVHTRWLTPSGWTELRLATAHARPDRLALAGEGIAFVAPLDGISAVWFAHPDGTLQQLTNLGLERPHAGAPDGFLPSPWRGPPTVQGHRLLWSTPDGQMASVQVPR
jgi:hypothetical protein